MNIDLIKEAIELNDAESDGFNVDKLQRLYEIWATLIAPYKHLFTQRNLGTHVGPGWWAMLIDAFEEISQIMKANPDYVFNVVQIKEKFGTLRFYCDLHRQVDTTTGELFHDSTSDDVDVKVMRIIERVERMSATTCEECGEAGSIHGKSWMKTLCEKHKLFRE